MKRLKKVWQGAFLTILLGMFFPCVNIASLSFAEYMVLVLFGVNIGVEALDLCPEEE